MVVIYLYDPRIPWYLPTEDLPQNSDAAQTHVEAPSVTLRRQ